MTWPCNASRNEHAGKERMQASTPDYLQKKRENNEKEEKSGAREVPLIPGIREVSLIPGIREVPLILQEERFI